MLEDLAELRPAGFVDDIRKPLMPKSSSSTMTALKRQVARKIVCDAFNHFTDLQLQPTVEGEKTNINSTLTQIANEFRIAIHGEIVGAVQKEGCTTLLGVAGFTTARYKKVRSVVNDVVALTNCP